MNNYTIGISPCPNDTYMFENMLTEINTECKYDVIMADIEVLNNYALNHKLDIVKVSFHLYLHIAEEYILLPVGAALGENVGPLLISTKDYFTEDIEALRIALPGKYTTANLLFSLAFPNANKKEFMLFSDIENAILQNKTDAGVIIHENRFTYAEKGLKKLLDLGEFWCKLTNLPVPLGGIAVKRSLGDNAIKKICYALEKSIAVAKSRTSPTLFIKQHAQEMNPDVLQKHINLYVNKYSENLDKNGCEAINTMANIAYSKGLINKPIGNIKLIFDK